MRTRLLRLSLAARAWPSRAPRRQPMPRPSRASRSASSCRSRPAARPTPRRAPCSRSSRRLFGQTVVIENRAGAGAVIGLDAIAKAAPDGYTFGIGPAGAMSVNPAMQVKMPFDVRKDLTAISGLAQTPFILAAPANFPANTLQEVIAQAKAAPGTPDASGTAATAPRCSSPRCCSPPWPT